MKSSADGSPGQMSDHADRVSPRAIRVSLVGGSADLGLEPCVVEPAHDAGPVQVDGRPSTAHLRMLDDEWAVLVGVAGDLGEDGSTGPAREAPRVLMMALPVAPGGDRTVERRELVVDGWRVEVELEPEARVALRALARRGRAEGLHSGPTEVRAMIPGVLLGVSVAPGDTVHAGQRVAIVEAMKMQNEVRAPRDGKIERVAVGPGTKIEAGDLLLVIS